jgi:hypothetical protein
MRPEDAMTPEQLLELARRLDVPVEPGEASLLASSLARSRQILAGMRRLPVETVDVPSARAADMLPPPAGAPGRPARP